MERFGVGKRVMGRRNDAVGTWNLELGTWNLGLGGGALLLGRGQNFGVGEAWREDMKVGLKRLFLEIGWRMGFLLCVHGHGVMVM